MSNNRHVFIDYSNLIGPILNPRGTLNVEGLVRIVTQGNSSGKRVVVGSSSLASLQTEFEKHCFNVKVIPSLSKERNVDDTLVAAMTTEHINTLKLGNTRHTPQVTFVLLSGDGNENDNFPCFKTTVHNIRKLSFLFCCLNHIFPQVYDKKVTQ
jgi:hypothetical protein